MLGGSDSTMHELSIAHALIESAEAAATAAHARRVTAVRIELGALAGVDKAALRFAYDTAAQGSLLAGSQLKIDELPVVIFCDTCACEQTLPGIQSVVCPVCGGPWIRIQQGRELALVALEVDA